MESSDFINPHQRCRYSDSPFTRIHYFYTAGSRNGLERVGGQGTTLKQVVPKNKTCYRKMFWGCQTGWKTRPRSAGMDNEAHWSCKRRVTAKLFKMIKFGSKISKIKVPTFWIPGIQKFPARGQCQPARKSVLSNPDPSFAIFGRASGQIFEKNRVLARRALTLV